MAENSAKVAKMARILAIAHITVGFLLICFGIADSAVEYFYTGYVGYGIWIGVWVSYSLTLMIMQSLIIFRKGRSCLSQRKGGFSINLTRADY